MINWAKEVPFAVILTDKDGKISFLNDKALKNYEKDGGKELIGKELINCHSANSKNIINRLINEKETNIYTIEKKGIKKLIYQAPYYENGEYVGLCELSMEIPFDMPHFVRS